MTTRLTPRAIKPRGEFMLGCREVDLTSMQPADAVEFFLKQGIKGTHAEIKAACAPYGYHPLSLRLLAGHILKDFENPADIIVAQKLKIDGDIIQQKHHVLEISYNSLPEHEQKLLSTIACFRFPVEFDTLKAIAENKETLEDELHGFVDRGLLNCDKANKKFDLHPIVRRYVYFRNKREDRKKTHLALALHYVDVAPITNKNIKSLSDLAPVIELYYHLAKAENFEQAYLLLNRRLVPLPLFHIFGAYDLALELEREIFTNGEDQEPIIKEPRRQSWLYNALANSYASIGRPQKAIRYFLKSAELDVHDESNLLADLGNVGQRQTAIGMLKEAEYNFRRLIGLAIQPQFRHYEAVGHRDLGSLLSYTGDWKKSDEELQIAKRLLQDEKEILSLGWVWAICAFRFLLISRMDLSSSFQNCNLALDAAHRTFELVDKLSRQGTTIERAFIRAHWILGTSYRAHAFMTSLASELREADDHLSKSLNICHRINSVEDESDILLDLARLRYDQKNYEEAKNLADEALTITEGCGYVLQGADVNLFLAQYALEQEQDKAKAKQYAEEAKKLATCDGPPYYYKVAYEEAERMLEMLNAEG